MLFSESILTHDSGTKNVTQEKEEDKGIWLNEFGLDFRKKWFDLETGHFHSFVHSILS